MASLAIKIFYLRTRQHRMSQQAAAKALGVRQATLSHIERGKSLPAVPLLLSLCEYYDVSPSYLLDEARGVVPLPSERWSAREALATTGMWVEVRSDRVHDLGDGRLLCPLLEGGHFYDEEAAQLRMRGDAAGLAEALARHRAEDAELEQALYRELAEHPKRRRPST